MFEVLVSMSLITLVVLSLLSFQIHMTQESVTTSYQTIALTQLQNFSEMLLLASDDADRQQFLSQWNADNRTLLPNANGAYVSENQHMCVMTLQWIFKKTYQQTMVASC